MITLRITKRNSFEIHLTILSQRQTQSHVEG